MRRRVGYNPPIILWLIAMLFWVAAIYIFFFAALGVAALMVIIWAGRTLYRRYHRPVSMAPPIYAPRHLTQR